MCLLVCPVYVTLFFFLMIRRPPRSTLDRSSAASDVYKRQVILVDEEDRENEGDLVLAAEHVTPEAINFMAKWGRGLICLTPVSYTHLRAHETVLDLVCRLLLEKKKTHKQTSDYKRPTEQIKII